jgi:hypothetical protein
VAAIVVVGVAAVAGTVAGAGIITNLIIR